MVTMAADGPAPVGRRDHDEGFRTGARAAALVAALWCVAFLGWQLLARGDEARAMLISDLAPMLPMALAMGLSLQASRLAPDRRTASAWVLMAAAFGAYLAGTAVWAWFELVRHVAPWPSLADVGFLAFYPLLLLGLLRLPARRRHAGERLRIGLDIAIAFLASAMAVWYFALGPTARGADLRSFTTILSLAYPVGDLVLVFGVTTLLVRGTRSSSTPVLRLLMAGCCAFVVGDIGFANLSLSETYGTGDWPDAFWMVAWTVMVIGLAGECRAKRLSSGAAAATSPDEPSSVSMLPYVAVAGAFSLAIMAAWGTVRFPLDGILLGAAAVTGTVVLRQLTAMRDNLRLSRELQTLATTDQLTQLPNRRHFLDLTDRHLRTGSGEDLCLIMADLDHFKSINDTYGHGIGDQALTWMATHCVATLPPDAVVGRLGGDEFVALLPGRTLAGSMVVAEQLVASVAASLRPVPAGPDHLSVSLGVASAHGCADVAALLHAADDALYESKHHGRSQVRANDEAAPAAAEAAEVPG